jgi:phospholipase/lecithinase/hemolysin
MITKIDFLALVIFLAALVKGFAQPVITQQPANQTASLFADATFEVSATGNAPLSCQWRFNEGDLIGQTSTTLTVTNVQRRNAGNYSVTVTNLSGSVTSQVATLTITPFNSMYCFGFSWTDTHNCPKDPVLYWHNHACNGPMWPEFFSTNLGLAYVESNNYAVCAATSSDILNQVVNFPPPPKPKLSLYCLWADGPDVDFPTMVNALTNKAAGDLLLQTTISNISNSVDRLYSKGARAILIEWSSANWVSTIRRDEYLSLLGAIANGALLSNDSDYVSRFDAGFLETKNRFSQTKPDLRILLLDVWPRISQVRANPAQYGFTVTTIGALDDPTLTDKSFTGPGADYMYWDFHGTSKLHKLIATWHLDVLTNSILENLQATVSSGSPTLQMNHLQIGRDYTLQKSAGLRVWIDIQTFTATAGTNQWPDTSGNEPAGYFRLKWER